MHGPPISPNNLFPFLVAQAFDDDAPNTPNSLIVFSIGFSDTTPSNLLFTIDPANGEISSAALDYEAVPSHIYSLIVYVTDSGTSPLSSMCSLTVIMRVSNMSLYQTTHGTQS